MCIRCEEPCSRWKDIVYMTFGALGMGYWMFAAVQALLVIMQ
jgi:hypothetical protein